MSSKKIYILCPEDKHPVGGVKQLYRLAFTLNKNGIETYIVHGTKGFKINWFNLNVPIKYFPFLFLKIKSLEKKQSLKNKVKFFLGTLLMDKSLPEKNAIIIYPEVYKKDVYNFLPNDYIIFNQNCYYTFIQFNMLSTDKNNQYSNKNLKGILTVSNDSYNYLKKTFPNTIVERISLGINKTFAYNKSKEKIIAFMPRKLKEDINQIYHILCNNPHFKNWEWQPINNCSEKEVAQILQKSAIFLSFNYNEGFGLPPVEAMACGCYVIGYAGNAGNEYFSDEFSTKIPDRNIIEFVDKLEEIVIKFNENPLSLIDLGKKASLYVQEKYNLEEEENSTLIAINNILKYNEIPL